MKLTRLIILVLFILLATFTDILAASGPSCVIVAWVDEWQFDVYGKNIDTYCQFNRALGWAAQGNSTTECRRHLDEGLIGLIFQGHNYRDWRSIGLPPPEPSYWVCAKIACVDKYDPWHWYVYTSMRRPE